MEIETDSGTAEMKLRMIFLQKADRHVSFWLPTELVKTTIKSPRWQTLSTGAVNFCEGREQISSELFHRCLKERRFKVDVNFHHESSIRSCGRF